MMQKRATVDRPITEALLARATTQKLVASSGVGVKASRFLQNVSGVVEAIRQGLEGVWSAVDHFKAAPPNVTGGLVVLGSTLMASLDLVITEEGQAEWPDYAKFRDFWTKAFEDVEEKITNVRSELMSFAEDGNVTSLISAVSQVLIYASDMVVDMVEGQLATTISRCIDTINRAFASIGEALNEFRDGDTLGGLQAIYYGLRNATQALWGTDGNETVLSGVVSALDNIVGGISQDVLDYQRRLAESKSCWKVSLARDRYLPSICAEGYVYDGERHCWPEQAATCWEPAPDCVLPFTYDGVTYQNCTSRRHSKPWCAHDSDYQRGQWSDCKEVPCASLLSLDRVAWGKQPKGTVPARCDTTHAKDVEKNGGWCYKACPEGYEDFGSRCWTQCEGFRFSFDSPLICGQSAAVLQSTVAEMVTVALRSALSLGSVVASMQAFGVNANNLLGTINVFVDMGKPFALPQCSDVEA